MADNVDWSFDQIRNASTEWNLAGDCAILNVLEKIHKDIEANARDTGQKLESLNENLSKASLDLQLVNNRFLGLSNTQFLENRVYDDEVEIVKSENVNNSNLEIIATDASKTKPKDELNNEAREKSFRLLSESIVSLHNLHERFHIVPDSDSDSADNSGDEGESSVILKPKDNYQDRPLPHIIGSQKWKKKWHIGLIESSSSSESEQEAEKENVEQYSSTDEDVMVDRPSQRRSRLTLPIQAQDTDDASMLDDDLSSESDLGLTRSNANDSSSPSKSQDFNENEAINTGKAKPLDFAAELSRKLQMNATKSSSDTEAPPVKKMAKANEDIFSNLLPPKPHERVTGNIFLDEPPPMEDTDETDDIYAAYANDSQIDDLFNDFQPSKPAVPKPQASFGGLFDDLVPSQGRDQNGNKPKANVGGFFSEEEDASDSPVFRGSKVEKQPKVFEQRSENNNRATSLFEDLSDSDDGLFSSIKSSTRNPQQETHNIVKGDTSKPTSSATSVHAKSHNKGLFDDDSDGEDLFPGKAAAAPSKQEASKKISLFDNDGVETAGKIQKNEDMRKKPIGGVSIFGDALTKGPDSINAAISRHRQKSTSDESEQEAFSKLQAASKAKTIPSDKALFDADSDDDLFSKSIPKATKESELPTVFSAIAKEVSAEKEIIEDKKDNHTKKPIGGVSIFGDALMKGPNSISAAISRHRQKSTSDESESETMSKPIVVSQAKTMPIEKGLFDADSDDELFGNNKSKLTKHLESQNSTAAAATKEENVKKPIGGVSIFGEVSTQGPKSISAAISRHTHKSISDESDDEHSSKRHTVATEKSISSSKDLFDEDSDSDLFSKKFLKPTKQPLKEDTPAKPKLTEGKDTSIKKPVGGASAFGDEGHDKSDLKSTIKAKTTVSVKGLFDADSDDDIFTKNTSKPSKAVEPREVLPKIATSNKDASEVKQKKDEKKPVGGVSIFRDAVTKGSDQISAARSKHKQKSSFDESDYEQLSKFQGASKAKTNASNRGLFDGDSDDELFSKKTSKPNREVEKPVKETPPDPDVIPGQNATLDESEQKPFNKSQETSKAKENQSDKGLFDGGSDDDLFSKKTSKPNRELKEPVREASPDLDVIPGQKATLDESEREPLIKSQETSKTEANRNDKGLFDGDSDDELFSKKTPKPNREVEKPFKEAPQDPDVIPRQKATLDESREPLNKSAETWKAKVNRSDKGLFDADSDDDLFGKSVLKSAKNVEPPKVSPMISKEVSSENKIDDNTSAPSIFGDTLTKGSAVGSINPIITEHRQKSTSDQSDQDQFSKLQVDMVNSIASDRGLFDGDSDDELFTKNISKSIEKVVKAEEMVQDPDEPKKILDDSERKPFNKLPGTSKAMAVSCDKGLFYADSDDDLFSKSVPKLGKEAEPPKVSSVNIKEVLTEKEIVEDVKNDNISKPIIGISVDGDALTKVPHSNNNAISGNTQKPSGESYPKPLSKPQDATIAKRISSDRRLFDADSEEELFGKNTSNPTKESEKTVQKVVAVGSEESLKALIGEASKGKTNLSDKGLFDSDNEIFGKCSPKASKQIESLKVSSTIADEVLPDKGITEDVKDINISKVITPDLSLFSNEPPEFDSYDDKVLANVYEEHEHSRLLEDYNANAVVGDCAYDEPPPLEMPMPSVAKLKHSLNINVRALMPNAKAATPDAKTATLPRDAIAEVEVLSNAASKERAKVAQAVKRRPSSRKARRESIRNSALFEETITESEAAESTINNNVIESTPSIISDADQNNANSEKDISKSVKLQPQMKRKGLFGEECDDNEDDGLFGAVPSRDSSMKTQSKSLFADDFDESDLFGSKPTIAKSQAQAPPQQLPKKTDAKSKTSEPKPKPLTEATFVDPLSLFNDDN